MSASPMSISLAQVIGLTAPALYSSLAFTHSYVGIPPLVQYASEKVLAKQWLLSYQVVPPFIPPLVILGTVANAFLAYSSPTATLKLLYSSAAILSWSILPVTLLYFEPGVNGAAKWKVQTLFKDEGFHMAENKGLIPSPFKHSGTEGSRRWAESVSMKDIANKWAKMNMGRAAVMAVAVVLSATATCSQAR